MAELSGISPAQQSDWQKLIETAIPAGRSLKNMVAMAQNPTSLSPELLPKSSLREGESSPAGKDYRC